MYAFVRVCVLLLWLQSGWFGRGRGGNGELWCVPKKVRVRLGLQKKKLGLD